MTTEQMMKEAGANGRRAMEIKITKEDVLEDLSLIAKATKSEIKISESVCSVTWRGETFDTSIGKVFKLLSALSAVSEFSVLPVKRGTK